MDRTRWERIQDLFHDALNLPESERQAFIESECAGDPRLLADVRGLLEGDAAGTSLLDRDVADIAHRVLDGSVPALETVGPYHIKGVLGKGGMGVVYLAEHDEIQHQVAIKVLRDASLSPSRRARFEREEQLLAQLNHPQIARLYDASALRDGTPYFVMEYVEGAPLTAYCAARRCSVHERLRLFRDVCETVQYAHRQAIIHRDLKPSNILVSEDGSAGDRSIKLLDFGVAKQIEHLQRPALQTQTGLRLMTPAYAAPEQIRGEALGVYTDVYALGVLLYEVLAGTHPFMRPGLTSGQVEALVLDHEPEKPSVRARRADRPASAPPDCDSLHKQAWADLDVLCLNAMHRDPQRRYATVEALVRDLDHYFRGEPLEARLDAAGYRLGKFLRRNRAPLAAATLVIAFIVGLVAFYTVQLADQRNRAQAEAEKAEQISEFLISLFEAGDPYSPDVDSLNVSVLLERGTARAEELTSAPAVRAEMLDVLGRIYVHLSEYDRAEVLHNRALSLRREAADRPVDVAETLANLGLLYSYAGAYDSAEVYMREALTLRERHLPPQHPSLASNLDELGVILNRKGEYERAEALYRLALGIQRDIYDGPHEDLGSTLNNLAVNQFDQGDYTAAEHYFRQALAIGRAVFGPEHPSAAVDLANLGVLLDTMGDYVAADSMLTEALRIKRMHLGNEHYETAFALTQLGGVLQRKGDYDRAEAYLREALAIEERVLDPGHRNTAVTLNHLALTLQEKEQYDEAEQLFRRTVSIFSESVGEQHPYTAIGRCHLAYLLHLKGANEESEGLFREGLATLEAALPPDHDILALNRVKYGALLAAVSRHAEAEPLLVDSYRILDAAFGATHPETRRAAQRLVDLYETWNRPDDADRFRPLIVSAP